MPSGLLSVFIDVVAPVFAIVGLGYVLGPRLDLDPKPIARTVYYVLVPAFTFDVVSRADVPLGQAARMAAYAVATHLGVAGAAWVLARALGRSREVAAAYVMLVVFGNVGNFGLALVQFRLGAAALVPATIYFIVILVTSFVVCVGVAAWTRGGGLSAVSSVFRTPAILVLPPAIAIAAAGIELPLVVGRTVGLLGSAMIPVMLLVLGLQLARTRALRITADVLLATGLRLLAAPALAAVLAAPFGLDGVVRAVGILQAGMPVAILVAIIANDYAIEPELVMTTVFFSTVVSLPTLTVLLAAV